MDLKKNTMVETSKAVGKEVKPDLMLGKDETPDVPGNYHEYEGSKAEMFETYSKRMPALEEALGNKDEVRG